MKKLNEAAKQTGIRDICIAGGVSANSGLRNAIEAYGKKYRWNYYIPDFQYCTDNAGMIAITGYYKFLAGEFADNFETASARSHF
jgi:N6-L-threonylcarbamoyladenine synthase